MDSIILCQPDNGEMALEVVDQLVRSSAVDIIAIDSVAALTPRAEIEGEIGNIQGGCTPARLPYRRPWSMEPCCADCLPTYFRCSEDCHCGWETPTAILSRVGSQPSQHSCRATVTEDFQHF